MDNGEKSDSLNSEKRDIKGKFVWKKKWSAFQVRSKNAQNLNAIRKVKTRL